MSQLPNYLLEGLTENLKIRQAKENNNDKEIHRQFLI